MKLYFSRGSYILSSKHYHLYQVCGLWLIEEIYEEKVSFGFMAHGDGICHGQEGMAAGVVCVSAEVCIGAFYTSVSQEAS